MGYMARLTGYSLRHKRLFFGFLAAAGIGTAFNLLTPLVLVNIIDGVIYGGQYDQLIPMVLLYISLSGLYAIFDIIGRYGAAIMTQKVIYDLRKELYDSLMDKDLAFYDQEETGQLLARVTTDVTQIREFEFWGYRVLFIGFAMTVGVYVAMFSLDFIIALYMLVLLPLMAVFIITFARRVRPVFVEAREQYGELSSVLAENIVGMKVIKSYSAGNRELERVERENKKFTDLRIEAFRLFALYRPLLPTLFGIVTGALIYIGGYSYVFGNVSIGVFVGFVTLIGMLMLPGRFLSWGVGMYERASASAERTFYILDHKEEVNNPDTPVDHNIEGKVTFQNVYFSYRGSDYILKDINMEVKPGQVVALLGGTGSGKTSLVNLIPRFYDADINRVVLYKGRAHRVSSDGNLRIGDKDYKVENGTAIIDETEVLVSIPGRVYIDDIDVRYYDISSLRGHIGMVHQDPFLFSASIQENIAFARPDAPLEKVIDAAKAANIHDFIMTLENGYESIIGERGVTLSGGQKQRIAIARALLADPRILILDDSTSSVDAKTEMLIQEALENLMVGRTTFIITHRLSTVRNADLIVMMEKGRIREMGSHDTLLQQGGLYAGIYRTLEEMELAALVRPRGGANE
ncbi:MAG: ABC transporter ATP-binding protein [Candidatus Thorarchaeota archaeon]